MIGGRSSTDGAPLTPEHTASAHDTPSAPSATTEPAPGAARTGQAAQTAPAPAAQATPTGAESTASASSAGPSPSYGVDLNEAIENVHATIELASRQGLTQARIQLEPAELGEIRIHLTQTAAGLVARVSAESAAASQALAAAHAELRQSLGAIGIDLARLHVGTHGATTADAGGQGAHEQAAAGGHADARQAGAQTRGGDSDGHPEATAGETTPEGAEATSEHTSDPASSEHQADAPGPLVDVLA